jgi:integrase
MVRTGCSVPVVPTVRAKRTRGRGSVVKLPSGALRVRVFAGYDPLTGRRHYLNELVDPGPSAPSLN